MKQQEWAKLGIASLAEEASDRLVRVAREFGRSRAKSALREFERVAGFMDYKEAVVHELVRLSYELTGEGSPSFFELVVLEHEGFVEQKFMTGTVFQICAKELFAVYRKRTVVFH